MATRKQEEPGDRKVVLADLARESLSAFEAIAAAANDSLRRPPSVSTAFATMNELTSTKAVQNYNKSQSELAAGYRRLQEEPAVARVVLADEDDSREVLFICRATPVQCADIALCSSLGPKGRFAALPVGEGMTVAFPNGPKFLEVVEKAMFRPTFATGSWDSHNTTFRSEHFGPLTIASLRDLLAQAGASTELLDLLERELAEDEEASNVIDGLRRSMITAMQLRDLPVLDKFQDEIFRLPLDSQLLILGPPGTGKTTTLVRRVRQKIDIEFLSAEEQVLVQDTEPGALPHASSWIMFTPTELLKQYVREAFAREGVPAPDQRIRTWDYHRRDIARRSLPVLRSSTGGTLVINEREQPLQEATISGQVPWFEDFDAFQVATFLDQVAADAALLAGSADPAVGASGKRLVASLERAAGRPLAVLGAVVSLADELRRLAKGIGQTVQAELRQQLASQLGQDLSFLADLAAFVAGLAADADEDGEENEDGEEEDEAVVQQPSAKKAAQAAFVRALRARAVAEVGKRTVPGSGRNGQILAWIKARGVALPPLARTGQLVIVQRAARRLMTSPARFVREVPRRYRAFRRERLTDGKWYLETKMAANEVTDLELDAVLLALFRNASAVMADAGLLRRLGERAPRVLRDVRLLQRNQVLVDEATDFSPVQLACMAALAHPRTGSFFACGDFNQRLTKWGSTSITDMEWVHRGIAVKSVDVGYRQSDKLNELARLIADSPDSIAKMPADLDNKGVAPVVGLSLGDRADLITWLSRRIAEIEEFTQQLPSIAVLVNDREMLGPLATDLDEALAYLNIKVVACPDGQVMGQENDVRVFEVEHIKGLEFEAVFFVNVDELEARQADLFDKYLYVGATRAATYLGMTCKSPTLPRSLDHVGHLFGDHW